MYTTKWIVGLHGWCHSRSYQGTLSEDFVFQVNFFLDLLFEGVGLWLGSSSFLLVACEYFV